MQTEKTINIGEIFMPSTYTEIIAAFDEHLQRSGRSFYNEFYIGVTNDAARRLFQEHNVPKSLQMLTVVMKLKHTCSLEEKQ